MVILTTVYMAFSAIRDGASVLVLFVDVGLWALVAQFKIRRTVHNGYTHVHLYRKRSRVCPPRAWCPCITGSCTEEENDRKTKHPVENANKHGERALRAINTKDVASVGATRPVGFIFMRKSSTINET